MRFLRVCESKSPPNSSKRDFIPICDGLWNATTQATLSRNGFAIEVSCCVKTQTDKPACLPENARLINLLVLFLRSFDTAQSSSIINVFVPEKKSSQIPSKSFISSTLLASGESTTKTLVSFGESSVSFIFRISRTNQYYPIKYMAKWTS